MYEKRILQDLDGYFQEMNARNQKGVYFYRICGYNDAVDRFIRRYYEAARQSGAVIEGRIPNPSESNLAYYEEIMGDEFQLSPGFLTGGLKKWLPRMDESQRGQMAMSLYDTLDAMRRQGKNENMQKNAFIKFMCWLYYRFEGVVSRLGGNQVPKILYEGTTGRYELLLLSALSGAGCDVLLLQYQGDQEYLKLDPEARYSILYEQAGMVPFPGDYSIGWIRKEMEAQTRVQKLYGGQPSLKPCTNAWISGAGLEDIMTDPGDRGTDPGFFYNCFIRITGVEDKLTCLNELYQFQLHLKSSGRKVVIVEQAVKPPAPDEIASVERKNYSTPDQMISDLSRNIRYTAAPELQKLMVKAFVERMEEEVRQPDMNLNRLLNKAVYQLCWLKRYQKELFGSWKTPEIPCFICLGGCKSDNEALFLRLLSRLPVDVLILVPDTGLKCCLEDSLLYEKTFTDSMRIDRFPQENRDIHMGTAAYHAERELDTLMYGDSDSGLYRSRQYEKAVAVTLRTMYEEIAILWDQELKYRPNFSVVDGVVNVPVIFAKVSGVKDGQVSGYWSAVRQLITEDTFVVRNGPCVRDTDDNPVRPHAVEFFKNGRLQKEKIKAHHAYQYGFLREEIQDHLLDKLQLLIEQKTIKGTLENGMEYTIISTVLNLKKEILRMAQKFDFTRKNPKLIYISTGEDILSAEDSIMAAFLNLVGFDVVFFVPTGYQNVEKYFTRQIMEEHQAGEYMYDLNIPDFRMGFPRPHLSWCEKIFKRGN